MHITPAGGNVFADLGFEPEEAAALQAESKRIISEKLAIKESLMAELAGWIDEKNLKQAEAARILGVTRPRVSDVISKKSIKFTIDALVDMLARTGKHVHLSVQ
jgi:predicted XRE-type DNA-binding protein